jgi:hypothetical protein
MKKDERLEIFKSRFLSKISINQLLHKLQQEDE